VANPLSQFPELCGSTTNNKDDVVKEVWWMLTGERDEKCVPFSASSVISLA
jgi:hypothetical protein